MLKYWWSESGYLAIRIFKVVSSCLWWDHLICGPLFWIQFCFFFLNLKIISVLFCILSVLSRRRNSSHRFFNERRRYDACHDACHFLRRTTATIRRRHSFCQQRRRRAPSRRAEAQTSFGSGACSSSNCRISVRISSCSGSSWPNKSLDSQRKHFLRWFWRLDHVHWVMHFD